MNEATNMLKQTDSAFDRAPYDAIQTDGCLWRTLLHCAELKTGKVLSAEEIKHAWHYSIPDYMEDHRHPGMDRCYIKAGGHAEIIRIGFHILGERDVSIGYAYRYDFNTDSLIIGKPGGLEQCNYFISKCKLPTYNHFYESDQFGNCTWNPGRSYSNEWLSVRGFWIEVR